MRYLVLLLALLAYQWTWFGELRKIWHWMVTTLRNVRRLNLCQAVECSLGHLLKHHWQWHPHSWDHSTPTPSLAVVIMFVQIQIPFFVTFKALSCQLLINVSNYFTSSLRKILFSRSSSLGLLNFTLSANRYVTLTLYFLLLFLCLSWNNIGILITDWSRSNWFWWTERTVSRIFTFMTFWIIYSVREGFNYNFNQAEDERETETTALENSCSQ